jgi:hypothetical protein
LASYNQPLNPNSESQSTVGEPIDSSVGSVTMPAPQPMWRSPGISRVTAQPMAGIVQQSPWPNYAPGPVAPPLFPTAAQVRPAVAGPNMGVRLRSVPSPPPQPTENSTPRIRLPGSAPTSATPSGVEQAAYFAPLSTVSRVETLPITPIQTVAYNAPATGQVVSSDGFRPRGSGR